MKEEWKVFIRGVEDCGNEVLKILEEHGGNNLNGWSGGGIKAIYFIGHQGNIQCVDDWCEFGKIIMDNYKEIKLPQQWKDGDLLVHTDDDGSIEYVVYKETKGFNDYTQLNSILTYANVNRYTYGVNVVFDKDKCKLASNEEHKEFYDLLHKHGVDWNAEKKQLVDWKWKPKKDEKYWFVSSSGRIIDYGWTDSPADKAGFDFGNCFRTKAEAEAVAERVKKALKGE